MKSFLVPVFIAALAAVLTTGCSHENANAAAAAPAAPPPPEVTVSKTVATEVTEYYDYTGRLDSVDVVEIRPRVSGYLQEIRFESGQLVQKGDILFVIDPRTRKAAFELAEANLERVKAQLEIAEHEAKRGEQLLASKTISPEESDTRVWKARDARAALAAAQASRDTAKLDLEFCEVRSPINGRVSRALVTLGNNVSGADGFTTLMTTVVSVNPMHVYSNMDENTFLRFAELRRQKKLPADAQGRVEIEMGLASEEGYPRHGYIESLDNRIDPGVGAIVVRSVFENPDSVMVPGLFVRLRIPVSERKPMVLISEHAIGTDQSQKFVFTLTSSNTVAYRPVKLGTTIAGKRVVRSGLEPGERIVVNGLQRVAPGRPVSPKDEAPAPVAQK
ncbi:MAG TPA: efflux RND transporter periplasmic adaptor subunit [Candidatus Limnocylindria bacterium]|nr:efflux RND transporter periplasmic adaptor subunit [Candidatus Limnocylindria bacterium]